MTPKRAAEGLAPGCRWYSIRSAAIYLDVAPGTIRAWISSGIIPCARVRHRNATGRGRHICTVRLDKLQLDRAMERLSK